MDSSLVVPNQRQKQGDGRSAFLKVVSSDKVFGVVHQIHGKELKHSGYKKVMDVIQRQYYEITRP